VNLGTKARARFSEQQFVEATASEMFLQAESEIFDRPIDQLNSDYLTERESERDFSQSTEKNENEVASSQV